jgi:hypothetical protein
MPRLQRQMMKRLVKRLVRALGYEIQQVARPRPAHAPVTTAEEYELLQKFATRTAQLIAPLDESQALRHLHLTGILRPPEYPQAGYIEPGGAHTPAIGIWKREAGARDAGFIRRLERADEGFNWAKQERIEQKRSRWRVAFLGESVARGYLYDPHFTPAAALEGMLRSALGPEVDVVDLAKSNLDMEQLRVMIGQCLALHPDLIVVFAGNNWHQHMVDVDVPYADTLLRRGGAPAIKTFLEGRAQRAIQILGKQVNDLLQQRKGLQVIWVVPEFNLLDWADPPLVAPLLPGDANQRWLDLDEQAGRAWRDGDAATVAKLAREMVELDGGTSAVPLRLLAQCSRAAGEHDEARRYLEMCRDADGWDPSFAYSPRTTAAIQCALREIASAPGNILVDAPDLLRRHLGGELPGRRVFLDYCHLTSEGIKVVMAAVASEAIAALVGKRVQLETFVAGATSPPAKIEAKASFLAAVHNAHFYQGSEVVNYWCKRAIKLWPEGAEIMVRYLDLLTRRIPYYLTSRPARELLERDELGMADYLFRGYRPMLDLDLATAIVDSLDEVGHDVAEQYSTLRIQERSVRANGTELNDFYHSSHLARPEERAWTTGAFATNRGSHAMYASALWKASKFVFIGRRGRAVELKFTYRLPQSSAAHGAITIDIHGHRVAEAKAERTWQTIELSIPGSCVLDGINEITVSWPTAEDLSNGGLDGAADALVAHRVPRFHRIFGEVHSLKVFDIGIDEGSANREAAPS